MFSLRKLVLVLGIVLLALWVGLNFHSIAASPGGVSRFTLGSIYAALILVRWKEKKDERNVSFWGGRGASRLVIVGLAGFLFLIIGGIIPVGQLHWLGLVLLLYACFRWSLPSWYGKDILLAMIVLYWVHPLPGQILDPVQMFMQRASVKGAEWFLHCCNYRVWADETTLYTVADTFMVPGACSGMVTLVTVLVCALGISFLFYLKWYECVALLFLGLIQVPILNVLRIAGTVAWAPRMGTGWGREFLHDTMGWFLLLSILLVHLEVFWWKMWSAARRIRKKAIEDEEAEPPDRASILPRFWHLVVRWGGLVLLIAFISTGTVFVFYKHRLSHRLAMTIDVAKGLMDWNLPAAEKVAETVLANGRDRRDVRMIVIRILAQREKYSDALAEIAQLPPPLRPEELILKSLVLMSMAQESDDEEAVKKLSRQAITIVGQLPDNAKHWPYVDIILAEYAAIEDQPEDVVRHIVPASKWRDLLPRVRHLYPYLASRERWKSITESEFLALPFESASTAWYVIKASIETGKMAEADRVLKQALGKWSGDPRFMRSIYVLAENRPGRGWEAVFDHNLREGLDLFSLDDLALLIEWSFQLHRPDLAWLAYSRLKNLDPRDPALSEMVARYGERWFVCTRHMVKLRSASGSETVDLSRIVALTERVPPFSFLWKDVPLGTSLVGEEADKIRASYVRRCLAEIENRKAQGTLSPRMKMSYPTVLAMAGKYDEAHRALDDFVKTVPERKTEAMLEHARLYDQQGKWEECYEFLRSYIKRVDHVAVSTDLIMIDALMHMNQGVYALEWAQNTASLFRDSRDITRAVVAVWDAFGFREQALFLLGDGFDDQDYRMLIHLLRGTGRNAGADKLSRVVFARPFEAAKRRARLLPAEASIRLMGEPPLSNVEMDKELEVLNTARPDESSPFMLGLWKKERDWYRSRGSKEASAPEDWESIGRDSMEKGAALHKLALLLVRQDRRDEARETVSLALHYMPKSEILWRLMIGLSGNRDEVITKAREECPRDPEIWLAWFVSTVESSLAGLEGADEKERREKARDLARNLLVQVESVADSDTFSPGTMVRAGDYLLRKGMIAPAVVAARDAEERCRGFVPAYVLAIRCAHSIGDADWALNSALKGATASGDKGPFYRVIAEIKMARENDDADLIGALEFLRKRYSNEAIWLEYLGSVYFGKGDTRRTSSLLVPLIDKETPGIRVQSYLLAAEAARREGRDAEAIRILERARAIYPDRLSVLNNLVYYLQANPGTRDRARRLLTDLLKLGDNSPAVLDTAAMVYYRSGEIDLASRYMKQALDKLDDSNYAAPEIKLNSARILFSQDNCEEARKLLNQVRRSRRVYHMVDIQARELLKEVEKKMGE